MWPRGAAPAARASTKTRKHGARARRPSHAGAPEPDDDARATVAATPPETQGARDRSAALRSRATATKASPADGEHRREQRAERRPRATRPARMASRPIAAATASAKTTVKVYLTKRMPRTTGSRVARSPNSPAFRSRRRERPEHGRGARPARAAPPAPRRRRPPARPRRCRRRRQEPVGEARARARRRGAAAPGSRATATAP